LNTERTQRLNAINDLIAFIVETDKDRHNPTLGTKENGKLIYSTFKFADNGLLYYIDSYTKVPMRPIRHYSWRGFSEGGTMRELVTQFGKFIMNGQQGFLNDYKEIWGWEYEATMKVRQKAFDVGFIRTVDYPYKRWGDSND